MLLIEHGHLLVEIHESFEANLNFSLIQNLASFEIKLLSTLIPDPGGCHASSMLRVFDFFAP